MDTDLQKMRNGVMGDIYVDAEVTLIVAAGIDDDSGIPGVSVIRDYHPVVNAP